MRDVFVGSLCAIGVFLICYRYRRLDDVLSTIAGVLAIMVALFPTPPGHRIVPRTSADTVIGWVHQLSSVALFLLLGCFCFFLFTRTDPTKKRHTPQQRKRNKIYRFCGGIILGSIVLAVASNGLPTSVRETVKPLFWCEAIAVFAFGVAWLVKGETVFKDALSATDVRSAGPISATDPLAASTSLPTL